MKKCITTAFLVTMSLLSKAQVSEPRTTANFSKIKVASGIELIYTESDGISVKAEAANTQSLKNIITEVRGTTLSIYCVKGNKGSTAGTMTVYVNANNVNSFAGSSKSRLFFTKPVLSDVITITVSSDASFVGTVAKNTKTFVEVDSGATLCGLFNSEYFEGNFKNSAKALLSGKVKKINISTASGAICSAKNLTSDHATITATDLSFGLLDGNGKIKANAEAGSSISYYGNPKEISLSTNSYSIPTKKKVRQ